MRGAKIRIATQRPSAIVDSRYLNGHTTEKALPSNGNGDGHQDPAKLDDGQRRLHQLELDLRCQVERLAHLEERMRLLLKDQDAAELVTEEIHDALASRGLSEVPRSPYEQLVRRIRELISQHVPRYSTVIVASKGDPALVNLTGRTGWHFPRNSEGNYAGYYPECALGAIAQLEALRAQGGEFFVLPAPGFWWLNHYPAFKRHLEKHYRLLVKSEDTCALYCLSNRSANDRGLTARITDVITEFQTRVGENPAILDLRSGIPLGSMLPNCKIFQPFSSEPPLPYLDRSVDIVVTDANDTSAVSEAWRVALSAVVTVRQTAGPGEPELTVHWVCGPSRMMPESVSIIIPCYNGRALTDACLAALLQNLPPQFCGEIIAVDDASTDDTRESLRRWQHQEPRLKVIRNRQNLGFVDTCNRGAREATGQILIFLNNDVILLPGWLPPLLHTFRDFPRTGAVGGKLILPDGTLQEAGGLVFCDGSAMNFGRGDTKLDAPLYSFVREVDYCSGALLATRRLLFEDLGGFDPAYRPGYYEDTDYCFKVRAKGHRVYYQPESVAVHREGGTAGTDLAVGMKRYQVLNQSKFLRRWSDALKHQPMRPKKVDALTLHALAIRNTGQNAKTDFP